MSWMQTHTGRHIDSAKPLEIADEDIDIRDIAWSLSMLCRYNGHCDRFYSVAEHCCHLFDAINGDEMDVRAAILLHDASEAYLSDIPRPLKVQPQMEFYRELEKQWMNRIYQRFRIEPGERTLSIIHTLDSYILCTEGRELLNAVAVDWAVIDQRRDLEAKLGQLGFDTRSFHKMFEKIGRPTTSEPAFWYDRFLERFRRLEL